MVAAAGKNTIVGIGVCMIGIAFYGILGSSVFSYARTHDFLSFYTGAKFILEGRSASLYDWDAIRAAEAVIAPGAPVAMPFIRPPFYAALLAPIALLPLNAAFAVWVGFQTAGLFAVWAWAFRRFGPDALVWCALFMPAARGIMHGQDCIFILLAMLGTAVAMEKGRDKLAGALVALTLIKFHLLLLLPVAMLIRRRWGMFAAYTTVALTEIAVSLWMIGPAGVRQYFDLVTRQDLASLHPSLDMMVNVHAIAANIGFEASWFKALLIVCVIAISLTTQQHWFWAAAIGSLLLPPHTYVYDLAFLLVPCLMFVLREDSSKPLRIAAATVLVPIPYLFTFFERPLAIVPSLMLVALLLSFRTFKAAASTVPSTAGAV